MTGSITIASQHCRTSAAVARRGGFSQVLALCLTCAIAVICAGAETQAQTVAEAPRLDRPPQPSLNFYGSPGLVDLPSGEHLPEGQFTTTYSYFGGTSRYNLTFQALPWLSASFRYNGIQNLNLFGFNTYYDRGFDVRFRLLRERKYLPTLTLGLQDFAGTGIYAAEYLAATKTFATPGLRGADGTLKVTAGLGWGRLGSHGAIGTLGRRGAFDGGDTGGELSVDQWFRGDVAPFAGLEWELNERWGIKAEYSSDAYELETRQSDVFERDSSLNFGVEYQKNPNLRLGAYYLYGSEIGLSAQIQLNPQHPTQPIRVPAPLPVVPRNQWATEPAHWSTDWVVSDNKRGQIRDLLAEALKADGLTLEAVTLEGNEAEVRYRNNRYRSYALSVGRVARAMARTLPPSVETLRIVPMRRGLALSATVIRRSDLEALEFAPDATDALVAVSGIQNAGPLPQTADISEELYPAFATSVSPYAAPAYFDPDQPFRLDLGLDFSASYAPAPGWIVSGTIRQRLWGNVADGRASNSVLPRVRTDHVQYAQFDTTLQNLYVARSWKPAPDLYARATVGLFESNFGGVSGEVLWKPVNSRLALGVEGNYVKQRDFDQRLSFRDYSVLTGHASAYYEAGRGYLAQVDVGRYLAGDVGATFSIDKTFNNGWSVGGFFTLTDVSAEEFGEGSFDKGIRFRIPLDWLWGKPSRNAFGLTVRPTQRDGGARVAVPGRLYGQIREGHRKSLLDQKARIWE